MSGDMSIDLTNQKNGWLTRLTHKQITPESAQSTAWVGSIAVGLTVQALAKDGVEGALYGGGASVAGLLALVSLLSISVSLPVVILVGVTGSILGGIPKASRNNGTSHRQPVGTPSHE